MYSNACPLGPLNRAWGECAPGLLNSPFPGGRPETVDGRRNLVVVPHRVYLSDMTQMSSIDELVSDFSLLDEWEDRYRYVIELGRDLDPLPESARTPDTKVQGCVSQVWITTDVKAANGGSPVLVFHGDSDAHIVRGLIAILFKLFSGRTAEEILDCDAPAVLARLGLDEHLTPQRSNGLHAMVKRIQADARAALAAHSHA
jgi:cysteine desulfuration protein SufE